RSCAGLPDHVDEEQQDQDAAHRVELERARRTERLRDDRARLRASLREALGLHARRAVALAAAPSELDGDRPEDDRCDHPAVPELVRVERDREPYAEDDR